MFSVHPLASDPFLQDTDKREFVEADDSDLSDFEVGEAPSINCKHSGKISCLKVTSTRLVSLVMG